VNLGDGPEPAAGALEVGEPADRPVDVVVNVDRDGALAEPVGVVREAVDVPVQGGYPGAITWKRSDRRQQTAADRSRLLAPYKQEVARSSRAPPILSSWRALPCQRTALRAVLL
jgi:hypothetical protein